MVIRQKLIGTSCLERIGNWSIKVIKRKMINKDVYELSETYDC